MVWQLFQIKIYLEQISHLELFFRQLNARNICLHNYRRDYSANVLQVCVIVGVRRMLLLFRLLAVNITYKIKLAQQDCLQTAALSWDYLTLSGHKSNQLTHTQNWACIVRSTCIHVLAGYVSGLRKERKRKTKQSPYCFIVLSLPSQENVKINHVLVFIFKCHKSAD